MWNFHSEKGSTDFSEFILISIDKTLRENLAFVHIFTALRAGGPSFVLGLGRSEVIYFINEGVRSALLHSGTVCSNGFLGMERRYSSHTEGCQDRHLTGIAGTPSSARGHLIVIPGKTAALVQEKKNIMWCFKVIRSLQTSCMTKCEQVKD